MISLNHIKHIYFLGIGGIGMSALARYFKQRGAKVSGYDRTPTAITEALISEGIQVYFDEHEELIPAAIDLVVFTPAIPADHRGYAHLIRSGLPMVKRAELLGMISREGKTLAVAGTHGKTTTSTLVAHLLFQSSIGCRAFLGGISRNYNNNLLISNHPTPWVVTEADEFDRSFLQLNPFIAAITSADADHLDIYGTHDALLESFSEFTDRIEPGGYLILKKGAPVRVNNRAITCYSYALDDASADCYASGLTFDGSRYHFDLHLPGRTIERLSPGIPAKINVENAVAACTMAALAGCTDDEIRDGVASFTGIRRRFDLRINKGGRIYIDDYAHHPEEIRALVTSVRHMFPGKRITGIFQPHLFSRTRDFAEGFATALSLLDQCYLLDIYPAREVPIEGITSELIAGKTSPPARVIAIDQLLSEIETQKPELLLTIGAGDIDKLVPAIEAIIDHQIKQSHE